MKISDEKLIHLVLKDIRRDLSDEDILHALLEKRLSSGGEIKPETVGARAADKVARLAGSWKFIFLFIGFLALWMIINAVVKSPFDPFPFILLNLALSCVAAIQAPIIMMSQVRQEQKDRERAENDYRVNMKTEIIIEDLHNKMDELIKSQAFILKTIGQTQNPRRD